MASPRPDLARITVSFTFFLLMPAQAQEAGAFEPFTHLANAESWTVFDRLDDTFFIPEWDSAGDGQNPDIHFSFLDGGILDFFADSVSSGGAFVGDLHAGGVDAIGCDIFVEDSESLEYAEFYLYSETDNRFYVSEIIVPESDGWSFTTVSLTMQEWFFFENGAFTAVELTPEILSNVSETGISFYPTDAANSDGGTVAIDNFTFYGALVLPSVRTGIAGQNFQMRFDRNPGIAYSVQSSTDLVDWSAVPGEEEITGNTPYTMNRALASGREFFRIGIDDFLTPVPDMGAGQPADAPSP